MGAQIDGSGDKAVVLPLENGKKMVVYSVRKNTNGAAVWIRCGVAIRNADGSMDVTLDALPVDGKLQIGKKP